MRKHVSFVVCLMVVLVLFPMVFGWEERISKSGIFGDIKPMRIAADESDGYIRFANGYQEIDDTSNEMHFARMCIVDGFGTHSEIDDSFFKFNISFLHRYKVKIHSAFLKLYLFSPNPSALRWIRVGLIQDFGNIDFSDWNLPNISRIFTCERTTDGWCEIDLYSILPNIQNLIDSGDKWLAFKTFFEGSISCPQMWGAMGFASRIKTSESGNGPILILDVSYFPVAVVDNVEVVDSPDDTCGCGMENVTLDASNSYDPDGQIVKYEWYIGNYVIEGKTITHCFPVGTTDVTLKVTDDEGYTDSKTISVTVNQFTCQGKSCGTSACPSGICDGNGNVYPQGSCNLNCFVPDPGNNNERIWVNNDCGRNFMCKCGDSKICFYGNSCNSVAGGFSTYTPPSGTYTAGDVFKIKMQNVYVSGGFKPLVECRVIKPDGSYIYFDHWGTGDVEFNYTIKSSDPKGTWTLDYCGIWTDFEENNGWRLYVNDNDYTFTVDIDTNPPTQFNHRPQSGWVSFTDITIDFDTNEPALCRWSFDDEGYDNMQNNCDTGYATHHSCDISGLVVGQSKNVYIACKDEKGNKDSADTNTELSYQVDSSPPSSPSPPQKSPHNDKVEYSVSFSDQESKIDRIRYKLCNSTDGVTCDSVFMDDVYHFHSSPQYSSTDSDGWIYFDVNPPQANVNFDFEIDYSKVPLTLYVIIVEAHNQACTWGG